MTNTTLRERFGIEGRNSATASRIIKETLVSGLVRPYDETQGAGVNHPGEWKHSGYHEIQGNRRRNTIIDLNALVTALELKSVNTLRTAHREWIEEALRGDAPTREEKWSQSIAVGSEELAQRTQAALGARGHKRNIAEKDDVYVLRETEESYGPVFGVKNEPIPSKNALLWDVIPVKTVG